MLSELKTETVFSVLWFYPQTGDIIFKTGIQIFLYIKGIFYGELKFVK